VPTSNVSDTEHRARELARELLRPAWARVRRIPLIRREIRESLSDNALELLFCGAELIVEGDPELGERAYATAMLTLDLRRSAALLREPADEATAERVAELMRASAGVRTRMTELARPRLGALYGVDPRSLRVELLPVIRVCGAQILIDGDLIAMPAAGTAGRRKQVAR
jgi:hypothetical protein